MVGGAAARWATAEASRLVHIGEWLLLVNAPGTAMWAFGCFHFQHHCRESGSVLEVKYVGQLVWSNCALALQALWGPAFALAAVEMAQQQRFQAWLGCVAISLGGVYAFVATACHTRPDLTTKMAKDVQVYLWQRRFHAALLLAGCGWLWLACSSAWYAGGIAYLVRTGTAAK